MSGLSKTVCTSYLFRAESLAPFTAAQCTPSLSWPFFSPSFPLTIITIPTLSSKDNTWLLHTMLGAFFSIDAEPNRMIWRKKTQAETRPYICCCLSREECLPPLRASRCLCVTHPFATIVRARRVTAVDLSRVHLNAYMRLCMHTYMYMHAYIKQGMHLDPNSDAYTQMCLCVCVCVCVCNTRPYGNTKIDSGARLATTHMQSGPPQVCIACRRVCVCVHIHSHTYKPKT